MFALNFLNIILLLAAAQGILLAVLIFHKYGSLFANRFLSAYILFYSIILLNLIFEDLGYFLKYPFLLFIQVGLPFLVGPLHFLYAKYLTHSSIKFKRREWFHLTPFIIYELIFLFYFINPEIDFNPFSQNPQPTYLPYIYVVFNWGIIIQGFIYMSLTLVLLKQYSRNIMDVFSTTEKIQMDWLRNITFMVTFVLAIFSIENILLFADINLSDFFDFSSLLTALAVYIMGYLGLFKSEVFAKPDIVESISQFSGDPNGIAKKYERSGLTDDKTKIYLQKLISLMENEKLYRDCDLTLQRLAGNLDISSHNLSQIINTKRNQNFFDFVNQYRVEEVKKDLADPEKHYLKILAIGLDAGFNSKSSFNTIFKKQTNMTPSEYRIQVDQSKN